MTIVAQKEKVETRMKSRGKQGPVTRLLFHETSADTTEKICKGGFDRSFAGKNGTSCRCKLPTFSDKIVINSCDIVCFFPGNAYGKGVYFATTAKLSCDFAKPGPKYERKMFLAEVITGKFCKGHRQPQQTG
ncbi:unnamed protein product [Clavelina lepadiformis]|uniref:Poly [ADP-ribose] polymerase n=1 Tax=Clavelina lepadiformis TaxID=159417 RepID=A0ABP0GZJ2_CLALP